MLKGNNSIHFILQYLDDDENDYEFEDDISKDPDFQILDYHNLEKIPKEMETPIKHCLRFGLSSASAMIIINSVLEILNR